LVIRELRDAMLSPSGASATPEGEEILPAMNPPNPNTSKAAMVVSDLGFMQLLFVNVQA
jgi:hypothetical protein